MYYSIDQDNKERNHHYCCNIKVIIIPDYLSSHLLFSRNSNFLCSCFSSPLERICGFLVCIGLKSPLSLFHLFRVRLSLLIKLFLLPDLTFHLIFRCFLMFFIIDFLRHVVVRWFLCGRFKWQNCFDQINSVHQYVSSDLES